MEAKLILARHGETNWNKELRFQGNKDIELNQTGIEQAHKLAARLENEKIDAIYSSNLKRAYQTAQIIAAKHNLEVKEKCSLQEVNFGIWEGLTFEEINQDYQKEFKKWKMNPVKHHPPKGENLKEVKKRVVNNVNQIVSESEGETILIVAHGGVNRVLISDFLEMPLSKCWRLNQSNTAINILSFYDSEVMLELFNSSFHL